MIPFRDDVASRRFPLANACLIALCTLVLGWELVHPGDVARIVHEYGLIPARLVARANRASLDDFAPYWVLVSSMFLHADVSHLLFNMLFLWVFGDKVEERLGHAGYVGFYLLGGAFASLTHLVMYPGSVIPTVGASGAIASVMGAYLVLYPRARILSFVPPLFWIPFHVPALIWLCLWWAIQLFMGSAALSGDPGATGVAWWAHAGGFAFGFAVMLGLGRQPS